MINEHKFKLDLKRRAGFFAIDLVESDTANRFDITLLDNGNPIDLTNHDVQAVFRRSDGKTIVQDSSNGCNINVAIAGTVTLSLLASSYRDGDNLCELQIIELAGGVSKTDSQITTARFVIRARKPLLNEDSINGSVEIPALHALIEALKDIRISITALDSESEATATFDYDEEGNIYSMSLGIPRGRNGIDGTDGRYVVRAYVEHEHLFIEMSDGELIDAGEVTDLERLEGLIEQKLDADGDGSAVTATRSMTYNFADIPTGEAITLAELLARLGGWYTQINSVSNELTNKLDKTGDASGASATYSTTTEFTSLPVREAIVFSRLLSILNGWYTQINSNIDAIQQLNTNKLDTNGDGSGVTVTPDLSVVQAFEEFAADETLPLEDVLARLNAWFSQIKVNSDSIETLALNKLNTDGDGSAVTATRSMTYNFADIPTGEAITLAELLARLGGWYAQINSVSNELTDKLDVADLEDATNAALQKAKESGEFNGADGKGIDTTTLNDDYTLTINYTDGTSYTTGNIRGAQGVQGNPGENGADGYTPVKGVDYYTAADKTEMVELVLAALPAAEGVSY